MSTSNRLPARLHHRCLRHLFFVAALGAAWTVEQSYPAISAEEPRPQPASALEVARQLNQAFIDVAARVTPAVVIISVAHRPGRQEFRLEDGHPFFEMLPPEFRERFEQPRDHPKPPRGRRSEPDKPSDVPEPSDRSEPSDKSEPSDPPRPSDSTAPDDSQEPVFDSEGSGVVIRPEGFIITNRHVVEGAEKIKVRFVDGTEFEATVRGTDAQSDLAVLKIDPGTKPLTVARFADSRAVRVGEFAIAIGAPLELDYSVTFGHISAKGRSRLLNDPAMDQDFLQTDANINPGNSGGPLVNIDGEVMGINTLIRGLRTGIGFAIPSNLVREVTDRIIAEGRFTRAFLGVRIHSLRDNTEYRDSIPGVKDGVVIFAIPAGSPAAKSALKPGDIILAVDGHAIASAQELRNEIRGKKIGSEVILDVHRFGQNLKVAVHPEAWPEQIETTLSLSRKDPAPTRATPHTTDPEKPIDLGLKVDNLTRDLAKRFQVERSSGVIVTEVERNGPAQKHGLRPGDVITEVNQKPVTSLKQFNEALKKADASQGVVLHFKSGGNSRFEILKTKP